MIVPGPYEDVTTRGRTGQAAVIKTLIGGQSVWAEKVAPAQTLEGSDSLGFPLTIGIQQAGSSSTARMCLWGFSIQVHLALGLQQVQLVSVMLNMWHKQSLAILGTH